MDSSGEILEYWQLMKRYEYHVIWGKSMGNEIVRLAEGLKGRFEGTNTIYFINKNNVPQDRWKDVTYRRICADYRPEKGDPYRIWLTIGEDSINYNEDCGTPTSDLLTLKLLQNSIVSIPGAKFFTMDIKNFYLNTPLPRYEYIRLKISYMSDNDIKAHGLYKKATQEGYVYVKCRRGMYVLPYAGLIAQELPEKRLEEHGYTQIQMTPGLLSHKWRSIQFTLIVDGFGVKYIGD